MTDLDSTVHGEVLRGLVARGHAPSLDELAARAEVPRDAVDASVRRLADEHALVLRPDALELAVVHPFSLAPTATWVETRAGGFWAPCLWCALGVADLAGRPATIHARLAGEAEPLRIPVDDAGVKIDVLVHFAIPPRDAWNDVQRFCATVLAFRDEAAIDAWSARHGLPRGLAVPLATVDALARRWYGRHLAHGWRKWTTREAQAIFASVGLTGDFWAIPSGDERF